MKLKNIIGLFLMAIGIFCGMILPFGYWFNFSELTQMEVLKELWGYMVAGIIFILVGMKLGELE